MQVFPKEAVLRCSTFLSYNRGQDRRAAAIRKGKRKSVLWVDKSSQTTFSRKRLRTPLPPPLDSAHRRKPFLLVFFSDVVSRKPSPYQREYLTIVKPPQCRVSR